MAGGRPPGVTPLERALVDELAAGGPVGFDQVVERALYDPAHGFYATGGRAGGDFLTSPEVGPLFGAVLARALDRWWHELGRPDRFTVVEAGAGVGTLARSVLAAAPACASVLDYVLVERAAGLRAHHGAHLDLADADADAVLPGAPGSGPRVWSRASLPEERITGVIVANELLDNLAFGLLERDPRGWSQVQVGVTDSTPEPASGATLRPAPGSDPGLVEVLVAASPAHAAWAEQLAADAPIGARIPDQAAARDWVAQALDRIDRGRLVVFDYADTTASLARRPMGDWVRTYRAHGRGGGPLEDLGRQDVTCEVATDQLDLVRPADAARTQAAFLADHGLDELVAEGRRVWTERAHIGDLAAIRARSRVGEAEALTDPAGLGAFTVLEWLRS